MRTAHAVTSALVATALLFPRTAAADACGSAYVKAQKHRRAGELKSARQALIQCSRSECIAEVSKDCVQWLSEVEASMPTIVVLAKDRAGKSLSAVAVSVDGAKVAKSLDGKALTVDPGRRVFKFEYNGAKPVTKAVTVAQGQKDRVIEVEIPIGKAAKKTGGSKSGGFETGGAEEPDEGAPLGAYVFGAVGLGAVIVGGSLWLSSEFDVTELRDEECSPACPASKRDTIETKRLFGDIAFGVGVVSLGIATVLFLNSGPSEGPPPAAALDIQLTPGGGFATWAGAF